MKILTIGAGVIGTTYSWQLQKAGYNITHLVRKQKIEQLRTQGIQIRCLDLRKNDRSVITEIYHPNFVDNFSGSDGYDYILVSVNSNQLVELLPNLKTNSGQANIVFLQNIRIGEDELISSHLDCSQYLIAYPFKAGGGRSGNLVKSVIFGLHLSDTVIGEVDGKVTPRVKNLYQMFKNAGMNPRITPDIIAYIRTHYIWGACCLAAYIKAGTYDRFKQDDIIKESYLAMRECWEICIKQGFDPRKVTPTRYYYLPFFLLIPLTKWLYNQKGLQEMFEGHVQHSPDEMLDMYYTLLAQGKKYDIKFPVYEGYKKFVEDYFRKL